MQQLSYESGSFAENVDFKVKDGIMKKNLVSVIALTAWAGCGDYYD